MKQFKEKKEGEIHFLSDLNYYVLGSVLTSKKPNDVDIIIVYNRELTPVYDLLEFRKVLCARFSTIFHLPLDIILISSLEEKSLNYINNEKAKKLQF